MTSLQLVETSHSVETYRDAAAKRIKALMQTWTANTLALGAELTKAAETFPLISQQSKTRPAYRRGFNVWAQKTTGLSMGQINSLMQVHKKFGHRRVGENRLSQNVMFLLSRDSVPETARIEALGRAEQGEHVGRSDAKKIAEKHKLPTPKLANVQAKEEGRPVLASDGYIYFGTDPGKAKEGSDRRKMVYDVRDALDTLGNIHLTANQFLDYAFPHQLWTPEEDAIIRKALRWLTSLDEAWEKRK